MKLRWLVERKEWRQWDSRENDWVERRMDSPPRLQYFDEQYNIWLDIETEIRTEKE